MLSMYAGGSRLALGPPCHQHMEGLVEWQPALGSRALNCVLVEIHMHDELPHESSTAAADLV